jgi:hypothetical protein
LRFAQKTSPLLVTDILLYAFVNRTRNSQKISNISGRIAGTKSTVLETDPGFKTEKMVTMMINPRLLGYDQKAIWRFFPELLRRIETQPGVRMAALTDDLPLQMRGSLSRGPIVKEGEADPQPNQGVISKCNYVSPKYFDTVQTPLVMGRDFTERDELFCFLRLRRSPVWFPRAEQRKSIHCELCDMNEPTD